MRREDPRGRRDPDMGDLLRMAVAVPALPGDFGERLQARLSEIDAEAPLAAGTPGSRRRPRRWALLAAAVLAALAVTFVIAGRHAAHEFVQPEPASAAEVVARVQNSLATFTTLSATVSTYSADVEGPSLKTFGALWKTSAEYYAKAYVRGHAELEEQPSHVIVTDRGEMRLISPLPEHVGRPDPDGKLTLKRDVPAERVYTNDDPFGTRSLYVPAYTFSSPSFSYAGQAEFAFEYVNTPLGPPDAQQYASAWTTMMDRANALSLLAHGTVKETTYDGRPALVVSADVTPGPVVVRKSRDGYSTGREYDHFDMTVDKATWLPVRYTTSLHGKVDHDTRLTDLQLDVPVQSVQFAPAFPEGAHVSTTDQGFRRVGLDEAAHTFTYRPLAPAALPGRFRFSLAAVNPKAVLELFVGHAPTVANHRLIPTYDVTALDYRAGFLSFTVTTRSEKGTHTPLLADPFELGMARSLTPGTVKTVTLHDGALAGEKAKLSIPVSGVPHLWAFHDGLLVTIGGDLTAKQLLAVAESLAPLKK
jgi:outer membrane lipoprotein-sorting protein